MIINKLLELFRPAPEPPTRSQSILEYAEANSNVVAGYKLCVTMSPSTPLKYLSRHGEQRSSIPEEERERASPYFLLLPEVSEDYAGLDRGATMSSSVGYIPRDGGDFLPFLIEIRKIVEEPRNLSQSELDDVCKRAARIAALPCGYGYSCDANYNLIKHSNDSGRKNYYQTLSGGDSSWALGFVLRELGSCPHDGLTLEHAEGYGSILEMVQAPDAVLLTLKGIGRKRMEKIRTNASRV